MESTLHNPALAGSKTSPKAITIAYWIFTVLFCLEMSFTAYWELMQLPAAAQAFARLGFPAGFFRVELSWAKVAGVAHCLSPWSRGGLRSGPTPVLLSTWSRL
jgi:DoxX-like family